MKPVKYFSIIVLTSMSLTSCYEDYVTDYDYPNMGFAIQRPLRTVVSNSNTIYVGVSIGGKREVDVNDWATFTIDPDLVIESGLTLMPPNYYMLSDNETFRVRRSNMPVADVAVSFTEDFYNDPKTLDKYYVIPFRITGTSIPGDPETQPDGAIREGAEYSLVAVKYISSYSGTYYLMGSYCETDAGGNIIGETVNYMNKDLSQNRTVTFSTLGRNVVYRPGLADNDEVITIDKAKETVGGLELSISDNDNGSFSVTAKGKDDGYEIIKSQCRYVKEGDYMFVTGDTRAPQFDLEYTYKTNEGKYFSVKEKLVLRQLPDYDLRVETY